MVFPCISSFSQQQSEMASDRYSLWRTDGNVEIFPVLGLPGMHWGASSFIFSDNFISTYPYHQNITFKMFLNWLNFCCSTLRSMCVSTASKFALSGSKPFWGKFSFMKRFLRYFNRLLKTGKESLFLL